MTMKKPQPQILTLWRIAISLIVLVPAFLTSLILRIGSTAWMISTICWVLVFLFFYHVYLPLRYSKISYGILDGKIVLRSGVFYTRVRMIPLNAIQFTSVGQTVLSRMFGLSSLVIYAAGGRMTINGLKTSDAEALAAILRR